MRPRVVAFLLAPLLAAGCGIKGRDDLVGRYTLGAGRASWGLAADGTCVIEEGGRRRTCEWLYREGPDGTHLEVTVAAEAGGVGRHYVLTPSRWPGQPVTIPLTHDTTLEKVSAEPGPTR